MDLRATSYRKTKKAEENNRACRGGGPYTPTHHYFVRHEKEYEYLRTTESTAGRSENPLRKKTRTTNLRQVQCCKRPGSINCGLMWIPEAGERMPASLHRSMSDKDSRLPVMILISPFKSGFFPQEDET